MIYKIYCLKSNNEVFYVGCTTAELKVRLSQHIWDANNKSSKKAKYIKELLDKKEDIKIELIEECNQDNWGQKENFWINSFSNLSNTDLGGSGIILNRSSSSISKSSKAKEIKICQLDLQGNYIRTFESVSKAATFLNVSRTVISNPLNGWSQSGADSLWLYEKDYISGKTIIYTATVCNKKKYFAEVFELDINKNIINTFENARDASNKTGIKYGYIIDTCKKRQTQTKGRFFKFKELEDIV